MQAVRWPASLVAVLMVLVADRAHALCVLPQMYVCDPPAAVLLDAVVDEAEPEAGVLRVIEVFVVEPEADGGIGLEDAGSSSSDAGLVDARAPRSIRAGDLVPVATNGLAVGDRLLALYTDANEDAANPDSLVDLTSDGLVAIYDVPVTAVDVADAHASGNCYRAIADLGVSSGPCNDTDCGCVSTADAAPSSALLPLLAAWFVLVRRRRTRSPR